MTFTSKQVRALNRMVDKRHVRVRKTGGRELSYIEGWYAISEANRVFGYDGWDRETVEAKCVLARETRGAFHAVYISKVRIQVRAAGTTVIREGHGTGEGKGASPGETHEFALKQAETDATKRALATFGRAFGLALYGNGHVSPPKSPDGLEHIRRFERRYDRAPPPRQEPDCSRAASPAPPIMPNTLPIVHQVRRRDRGHLKFVAMQPCLICGRSPSDPHHLRFAQAKALGRKVSDEFTVPLCRIHHRDLHRHGDERDWWMRAGIAAEEVAAHLWEASRERLSLLKHRTEEKATLA